MQQKRSRQNAAVLKIQKLFRGFRARQEYKQMLIRSLDELYDND